MIPDVSNIRYVFCDLDGTILDDQKQFTKKTKDAIHAFRKQTKHSFGIATGRALTSLLPLLEKKDVLKDIDVIVANNGVDVYFPTTKKQIRQFMLPPEKIREIVETFQGIEEINICFHNPNLFYAQKVTQRVSHILRLNQIDVVFHPNYDHNYKETPRVMLLFHPDDRERVEQILQDVHIEGVRGIFSERDIYEYVHEDVSKVTGIKQYVANQNDSLEVVMSIGDSYNDEEMLSKCGIGVAMKNAPEEVKTFANVESEYTNNEDGVAQILNTYWNLNLQ